MEQTNKRPLVILTGPTAVGKTAASIGLAKAIGGEIISADSMQVYKEMDIGSAKIRPEEMDGVPHHLVDVLDPSEDFNVVLFQQMAKEAMEGIYQRGHIPIVVEQDSIFRHYFTTLISQKIMPILLIGKN
jgi:tRNA dimethylallyltransferase